MTTTVEYKLMNLNGDFTEVVTGEFFGPFAIRRFNSRRRRRLWAVDHVRTGTLVLIVASRKDAIALVNELLPVYKWEGIKRPGGPAAKKLYPLVRPILDRYR